MAERGDLPKDKTLRIIRKPISVAKDVPQGVNESAQQTTSDDPVEVIKTGRTHRDPGAHFTTGDLSFDRRRWYGRWPH